MAMRADQHALRKRLQTIVRRQQRRQPVDREKQSLEQLLQQSLELRQRRVTSLPELRLDESLPIWGKRDEIAAAIGEHQVVVVCGETGSGKSTQLPKICLAAGRGISGFIGHTQPRRIAARTIASRLADELQSQVGGHVGFKIRFTDTVQPNTYVKLMTDGILLAETQQDRYLERYDTLIIDEAHERSLNIDFLLGYVKRLLPKRPDLRMIITSATIDAERFAAHFGENDRPAPVIEVSGRSYPVETRYRPTIEDGGQQEDGILDGVAELFEAGPGDILIFLPTEREIRDVAKRLRGWSQRRQERAEVLPLYSRLSTAEQNRVFQVTRKRRIVLATNVAESSLTVPGIRYVIDTGTARISRYSPRSKVQRLPIEAVSRASADQRQGRCGRVAPGICVRLYGEDDYLARDRYTTPEIRRTNLAAVILQMLALRLGAVDEFPFLDPPRADAIRDGYKTLFELGAIDQQRRLTELGKKMSRLPVDPRIARMILAAEDENCLAEMLIIAAALEVQDPRDRPVEKQQAADEAHRRFANENSDFVSLLTIWDFFHRLKGELSRSQLRKACQQNFLSHVRLREWQDVHRQLKQLVESSGLQVQTRRDEYDAIHRALVPGLLSNVAVLAEWHEYQAAGGARAFLWPGSGLFGKKPKWVVAAEAVETSKRYLRTVARVEPDWIESRADHLVKRSYYDPYWSRKQGTVMASEKVSLFGLLLTAGRRVPFGRIDAEKSRALFIQHALVEGQVRLDASFFKHNQQLVEDLRNLGARSRRAGYLIPEGVLYEFYDVRLPHDVHDVATLRPWLQHADAATKQGMQMREADLIPEAPNALPNVEAFPDELPTGSLNLSLDYRYVPGDQRDGVSLDVPLAACRQLDAQQLEWAVPGLLEEKLVCLIRSLPKSIRRSLVPAPESAAKAASRLDFGSQPFLPAVAAALSEIAGETIPLNAFDLTRLPQHLRVHVRVVDDEGEVIAEGRDLDELRKSLPAEEATDNGLIDDPRWQLAAITQWDFGELPREVVIQKAGMSLTAYPALVDAGDSVALRLIDRPEIALRSSRRGVRRLVCLKENRELKSQVQWLPQLNQHEIYASTLGYVVDLPAQLRELLADLAFLEGQPLPRDDQQFQELMVRGRRQMLVVIQDLATLMLPLWEAYHDTRLVLDAARAPQMRDAVQDAEQHLRDLLGEGFLIETPWPWLQQYPRYLQAIAYRIDKLTSGGAARDEENREILLPFWLSYLERHREHELRGIFDPELQRFRWLLEELRVSLFAQQLGTAEKVSPKRLDKQWAKTQM